MIKRITYLLLAVLITGLWGVTAFVQPDSHQTVRIAGITHHERISLPKTANEADPLAGYTPSKNVKAICTWILGAATIGLLLFPLAAWELTLPFQPRKLNAQSSKS